MSFVLHFPFSQKLSLKVYIAATHQEKMNFKCDRCEATFNTYERSFDRHVAFYHEGKNPFKFD